MIVWINGAFGSGKTQTAHELHRRIPESFIFDPEEAGYYIRKNIPTALAKNDFQDFELWREINYAFLKMTADQYSGIIIVPMTIVNPQYFAEIVGKLQQDGFDVRHFTLYASKEVLLKRLRTRAEGANSWAAAQIDRCMEGHSNPIFEQKINTNNLPIEQVAEQIASELGIDLLPDSRSTLKKSYDRLAVKLKHIRLF